MSQGSGRIGPVPWLVVAALTLLAGHLVLTYTRLGRYVSMVGGIATRPPAMPWPPGSGEAFTIC